MASGSAGVQPSRIGIQQLSPVSIRDALESAIAPHTASDMVAPDNIAEGGFVFAAGKLFRATANIASGSAITPGTNAIETTIGEQLTALWAAINS